MEINKEKAQKFAFTIINKGIINSFIRKNI